LFQRLKAKRFYELLDKEADRSLMQLSITLFFLLNN